MPGEQSQRTRAELEAKLAEGPPPTIGKYRIENELGRGTCGVVYKGFDPFVRRTVAVKLALAREQNDPNAADKAERTFFSEAHAAGSLQHPHIVSIYDAGTEGDFHYIVMEFVAGRPLSDYASGKAAALSTDQIIEIGFRCAKALAYSHAQGVLHRDIKPGNIMLAEDGDAKIMDFSIAEFMQGGGSMSTQAVVGSPAYMAPEQIAREGIGPRADLYGLGAVLYHLLAGEPPFVAQQMKLLFDMVQYAPAPQLSAVRPDLPPELCNLVNQLLEKDPEQRPAGGEQVASVLAKLSTRLRHADRQIQRKENRNALSSLRFFERFNEEEIDELLSVATMLKFAAGDTVVKEGDTENAFYIIANGQAEVFKGGKSLSTLNKGDVFGEMGFLTSTRRTATVKARCEMLALRVTQAAVDQVSDACQLSYYRTFAETLIFRLAITSARLGAKS
ncbi:MAG: serine/threonine-protein kinase [Oceanococcaceae bacterium]